MAVKNLSGALKQKLIQQSLQRKLKQAEQGDSEALLGFSLSKARLDAPRFDQHPGYKQLQILRQGAERLGVTDPFFRVHDGVAGATTSIEGRPYINFASYNYLGFSGHPEVNAAAKEAVDRYGTSVSASRPVSGERPIHRQLESALAEAYGVDSAVAFVSGHATNVTTLGYLMGGRDLILHDELIHNSSLVGAQLSGARRIAFAHNDCASLERILEEQRDNFERVLIVVEGLYSMDGDFPDLPRMIDIKRRYRAWLMVDEAHSFGVMGPSGLGIREHFGLSGRDVDIWMGTLSKVMSGCGGYIAGEAALCDMLRHFAPGFLYSVGMPAQVAAPALASLQLLKREPERVTRLQEISRYFLEQARAAGFDTGPGVGLAVVPVITGSSLSAAKLSDRLYQRGINVQPILHPAVPEKSARLRFFLSCEHTHAQIDETLAVLKQEMALL